MTDAPETRSAGWSGSLTFICWGRNAANALNDRALARQSSNSCHDAGEPLPFVAPGRVSRGEKDDFIRPFERQAADEHRVHESEDRRVDPDAQAQRHGGDRGEPGVFEEHANGVAEVLIGGHGVGGLYETAVSGVRLRALGFS